MPLAFNRENTAFQRKILQLIKAHHGQTTGFAVWEIMIF